MHTEEKTIVKRFDIVVLNYKRIESFFSNFDKIINFNTLKDRITILSSSPSVEEAEKIDEFSIKNGLRIRYLVRENRGIDQLARCEYFSGQIGSIQANLEYNYIFQMQDHYLDTTSNYSKYGPELCFTIKGDVVPNKTVFDLNLIENLFSYKNLSLAFCDRLNPCWFELGNKKYIAPNGGNFIIKSTKILENSSQCFIKELAKSCDNSYDWAVFTEFMWGYIFFKEGERIFDLKRNKLFTRFAKRNFHIHNGPDNPRFKQVFGMYSNKIETLSLEKIPLDKINFSSLYYLILWKIRNKVNNFRIRILLKKS